MSATTMNGQHFSPPFSGPPPLPANLTPEFVSQTYEKYNQLRSQGTRDDDPEFIKVRGILSTVQQQNQAVKQRQLWQQRQEQQQQLAHQQVPQNGEYRQPPLNASAKPPNGQPNGRHQPASGDAQPDAQRSKPSAYQFSVHQRSSLRDQIAMFKLLTKNTPPPPTLQKSVFPSHMVDKVSVEPPPEKPAEQSANIPTRHNALYETFAKPEDFLHKYVPYAQHISRKGRPMIPGIMPPGVDIDKIRADRETIVYNRIEQRREELAKRQANLDAWDTTKHDTPQGDGSLRLKALIEYKKLCLLQKQRGLRQQISREIVQADNLSMTANRAAYRRLKKVNIRETRTTEKFEKDQRNARETQEKKKHADFLKAIAEHGDEVKKAAQEQKARIMRLGRTMILQHQTIEREEQKRIERTAKQRLQALKANDEETYLKLLGQAKDSRISHLLKQTDGFLNQLASSVKDQQRVANNRYNTQTEPEVETAEEADDDDAEGGKRVDYYEVAHNQKESVAAQSSNLVGGTLKEYQLKGLEWMISLYNNNLNGILADEMGLGKTIQSISLITYLIEKKRQHGPFLVVVPLSTLTNWNNEFEKWAPTVNRIVYKGPPTSRKTAQNQIRSGQFQVLLTTYEFIIKDRPVLSKVKWLHMIVDEGHRMKNAGSKLSSTITQYYHTRYRLILTGTPLQNNLSELWALLNFVLPNIFKSAKSFSEWFSAPFANTGGQDSMTLTEEESILVIRRLHKVLRPFLLRRLKKDVEKDLPDKQERVVKCNFSALQARLYKQLVDHNRLMVSDGKGGRTGLRGLSNMLMQLRKLCNHPFVFEEVEDQVNPSRINNDLLWRSAGKFELLERVLPKFERTGHRVLMFFQMTQIMNIMEDFMRLKGFKYLRLDGSTKADERADLLKEFNAPNSPYFCFLLSTRAGGLGLNLQTADTVIIFDSDWNPHQDLQAQDRAHRIGQKNEVRILRLISSKSVEEKILERANYKLDIDGKVIQAGKFDNKSTNEERDAMLKTLIETAETVEDLETEEMDDEDLNMIMMRSEEELVIFQKMDEEWANDPQYGTSGKLPRLMGESELPDIYLQEDNPVVEELDEPIGRGARERTKVKYDDGLTEEQWLEAVDNDEDTIEEAIARKRSRIEKRQAKKEQRAPGSTANSPVPSRESSESPAPKKRVRKAGRVKRTAEEASLDSESVTSKKPRRGTSNKPIETLSSAERQALQDVLDRVYEALQDLKSDDGDGEYGPREVINPFIALPDKKMYSDYYQWIKNPICMKDIEEKINGQVYQGLDAFADDMRLLCSNCRQYNEDGSVLYSDATLIEETAINRLREETASTPALGNAAFTDRSRAASVNGGSTAPASGPGTPVPSGQKLKINLGAAKLAAATRREEVSDEE